MSERDIFMALLDLPTAAERARHLDAACGGDADLRRRVEKLLGSHEAAGSFLDLTPAGPSGPDRADTRAFSPEQDHAATRTGGGAPGAADDEVPLGFLAPATRPDSLGRIGHYEVLQVIGQGGFGIVFRAFDDVLHRVVAVKVLAPQLAATSPARKRFLREARSSAQVRHENVVQVYEVGETPLPYIAMEFIPGETLQERLKRVGPVDPAEVVRVGRQVAEGLAAAHATDLIHRDIKPGNILLEGGAGRVKITDFGLARAADDASISQSGIIAGTPMYMAPEQAKGEKLDQRADLFSLGSVLYQMACGRPPFRANGTVAVLKRVADDTPRDIREIVPEVPQWLCDIIAKLHAKNPDDRYQSARDVADVLADCEAQLKANSKLKDFSRIPRGTQPAVTKSGSWKWVAAAVVLLPLLALAVTEFAGVTHLFRGQEAMTDLGKPSDDSKPVHIAKGEPPPLVAVAPFDATQAKKYQEAWAQNLGVPVETINSIGMKLRLIPPGKFTMGSSKEEIDFWLSQNVDARVKERLPGEGPQHDVEITQPFYLGQTEVTVGQFRQFVQAKVYKTQAEREGGAWRQPFPSGDWKKDADTSWMNPGFAQTDDHPVVCVSWNDAVEFCNWLSKQEGKKYRLPTEAEWEYSCRAGSKGQRFFGENGGELFDYARFRSNSQSHTWPVAGLQANAWGLHDIYGNVWQWCQDVYDVNYYQISPPKDPPGPDTGRDRVTRGGNWYAVPVECRSAFRSHDSDPGTAVGFRVVLVAPIKSGREAKPGPAAKQEPPPPTFKNTLGMEFVKVPKGKSWLGGGKDKLGDKEVEIPADFYLGKYEVTQEEWEKVMGENPSHFSRTGEGKDAVKDIPDADLTRSPVENVSWDQCQEFVAKLNQREKGTGWVYRLPTEKEWEYACRGGPMSDKQDSAFDFYHAKPTNTLLPDRANIRGDSGLIRTCQVGRYEANRLGLFDMSGSVWEWCEDAENPEDPASKRMNRGGGWSQGSEMSRASVRAPDPPTGKDWARGLRLARVPSGAPSPLAKSPPSGTAPFSDADVRRIAALPAAEQVEEVRKELVRRNPGFDGKVEHKIEDGVVTEFRIVTDKVTDIAPIRVFNALRLLSCSGTYRNGQLADLTPLKGMSLAGLTQLDLADTKVTDAEMVYFKGCKNLTALILLRTQVGDAGLVHFQDCKELTVLRLDATQVSDAGLAHFKGCKALTEVFLGHTKVSDAGLASFKDCKNLTNLFLDATQVSDAGLAPLKEYKNLTAVAINNTRVSDAGLAYLKGMPLRFLYMSDTPITDLTPLQGMPLEKITLTPNNITRGLDFLRDMKSLKTIGIGGERAWPAAEFWERYDRGEFKE